MSNFEDKQMDVELSTITLDFFGHFKLEDIQDIDFPIEKGGIYFHYIIDSKNKKRIIYVGKCESFQLRQKQHLNYYKNNRYSFFEIDDQNDNLNIKYIPNYDIYSADLDETKNKTISKIYVSCAIVETENCTLEEIEGAIINQLYRSSETRKYLLNSRTNYTLKNSKIFIQDNNCTYYGLDNAIITPRNYLYKAYEHKLNDSYIEIIK